jgi:hypothetical protein
VMKYDVVAFFNGSLATIMGIGVVCLTHAITFPTDTAWQRRTAEPGCRRISLGKYRRSLRF